MLAGAHMSIAGGVFNAITRGLDCGCNTIQIFTKSNNQWKAKVLTEEDVAKFKQLREASQIAPVVAHDSYLINLGTQDDALYEKSIDALFIELGRAEALELSYLVIHPGAHVGAGEKAGLRRIAQGIKLLHKRTKGYKVRIALETTAGQGTSLGYRFEQLAQLLDLIGDNDRLAICLDTCHIFAAGYDIRTPAAYKKTLAELDDVVGLDMVKLIHLNDSKKGLGSRVDRHQHIGRGEIGSEGFRLLVNDSRFARLPMILETPKKKDGDEWDLMNLGTIRGLVKAGRG